jgi:hypothetical protein
VKDFLKTYSIVAGILLGILAFVGLLFWGLNRLFGDFGFLIGFSILMVLIIAFGITASIENGKEEE